jgi:hypothetical protein
MEKKLNKDHPEKYVVLEHIRMPDRGFRFWSTNTEDNTHGHNGELWYKEILFTNDEKEAIEATREHGNIPNSSEIYSYYEEMYKSRRER